MNFFDYLNNINNSENDIMHTEDDRKAYNSFMINRGLSYFPDTVLQANLMNMNYHTDVRLQYDVLRSSVRKKKRFSKWVKAEKQDNLQLIEDYYNCSLQKAKDYVSLLSTQDINTIKDRMDCGGVGLRKNKL